MLDWQKLQAQCLQCRGCGLCETRTNVVFGVGPMDADVMLIGEGPGEQEDLKGEPFVGPAGKLLDDMMSIIDLNRQNIPAFDVREFYVELVHDLQKRGL
jgi:DNA polymerase